MWYSWRLSGPPFDFCSKIRQRALLVPVREASRRRQAPSALLVQRSCSDQARTSLFFLSHLPVFSRPTPYRTVRRRRVHRSLSSSSEPKYVSALLGFPVLVLATC
jgi:hypothetical protein